MGRLCVVGILLGMLLHTGSVCGAAENYMTDRELTKKIANILLANPELVMDVLRQHSEEVLEIAQIGSNLRRKHNLEIQWQKDAAENKSVKTDDRPVLGVKDAKVRIVAFSDFTCHYCMQASQTLKDIMDKYGHDVCLIFKHLPMDEKGPGGKASEYFIAISQQDEAKAWKFYQRMFANRDKLMAEGEDFLKKTSQDLNVDMKKLQRELQGKKIREIMKEDEADAKKLGVEGTPYFLVNNLVVRGALPRDLFDSAVDMALKHGKATSNGNSHD